MDARFELTAVAFMRSTGGRVSVLLCVDRDGVPLFDGDPALLVDHRPGAAPDTLELEGADRIRPETLRHAHEQVRVDLAQLVDGSFGEDGEFDGQRLLGRTVVLVAPRDSFEM